MEEYSAFKKIPNLHICNYHYTPAYGSSAVKLSLVLLDSWRYLIFIFITPHGFITWDASLEGKTQLGEKCFPQIP